MNDTPLSDTPQRVSEERVRHYIAQYEDYGALIATDAEIISMARELERARPALEALGNSKAALLFAAKVVDEQFYGNSAYALALNEGCKRDAEKLRVLAALLPPPKEPRDAE